MGIVYLMDGWMDGWIDMSGLPSRGRMIRWEVVKSLEGVVGGSGNLSRKSGASGHWDTGRNGKTGGREGGEGQETGVQAALFVTTLESCWGWRWSVDLPSLGQGQAATVRS